MHDNTTGAAIIRGAAGSFVFLALAHRREEDIWDIGAITALFAASNRMANLIAMRPNDEFYSMGR